jgi:hypothetical protein
MLNWENLHFKSHAKSCMKGRAKEEAAKMERTQMHEFRGNKYAGFPAPFFSLDFVRRSFSECDARSKQRGPAHASVKQCEAGSASRRGRIAAVAGA